MSVNITVPPLMFPSQQREIRRELTQTEHQASTEIAKCGNDKKKEILKRARKTENCLVRVR